MSHEISIFVCGYCGEYLHETDHGRVYSNHEWKRHMMTADVIAEIHLRERHRWRYRLWQVTRLGWPVRALRP